MKIHMPKDIMRGKARDIDGCDIEFENDPEHFFAKIKYEHIRPAKECGARTVLTSIQRRMICLLGDNLV